MKMIEFADVDSALKTLGKNRRWLAANTGRSLASIRDALAPNAPAYKRSRHLQWAISNAIENEVGRRHVL